MHFPLLNNLVVFQILQIQHSFSDSTNSIFFLSWEWASLTNRIQIYFFLMFLTTFKTRKLHEGGNSWHSGWWGLKSLLLIISMVLPIFFPAGFIQIYGMQTWLSIYEILDLYIMIGIETQPTWWFEACRGFCWQLSILLLHMSFKEITNYLTWYYFLAGEVARVGAG